MSTKTTQTASGPKGDSLVKGQRTQAKTSAWHLLTEWANQQENWVRSIVRDVLTTRQLPSDQTLAQAYATCLSEKGLSDQPITAEPALGLDNEDDDQTEKFRLIALKEVKNVNRLAAEQEIRFNSRLTLLFGENATAKGRATGRLHQRRRAD